MTAGAAGLGLTAIGRWPFATELQARPTAAMFSFDGLRQRAMALAERPYVAPTQAAVKSVNKIDFDAVQKIKFRADHALWAEGSRPFPVHFFHLNKFSSLPVRMNEIVGPGIAQRIRYRAEDFDYGDTGLERSLPRDLGFSGFRVMEARGKDTDWLAFQGASYFRSSGEENQYGASARGIAVDTALPTPEEFPRFTEFWLAEPDDGHPTVTIFALLDGPSVTGAYQFEATRTRGAVIDVRAHLFARTDIARLGLAPLTSMYWYSGSDKGNAIDWRPEIHDSDGLAMWTGKGEHIWRPLINPPSVRTNSFLDTNPKGFGLMQRSRNFASYEDDSAFYERRPSIWVEPIGDWGKGAVQLVEIPTRDEIHDNIVAYWHSARPVSRGDHFALSYRLYWQNDEPHPPTDLGRVIATRTGIGGVPGRPSPDDNKKRRFVIDFEGGPLADMAARFDVTPVVTASQGRIDNAYVVKIVGTSKWRALFDLWSDTKDTIDLRCYLRLANDTLTETWLYQHIPV